GMTAGMPGRAVLIGDGCGGAVARTPTRMARTTRSSGQQSADAVYLPYRPSHASRQTLTPQIPQDAAAQIRACGLAGKQANDVVVTTTSLLRRESNNHVVRPSQSWWGGKARCSTPLRAVINRGPRQSGLGSYQVELVALGVGEGGPPD